MLMLVSKLKVDSNGEILKWQKIILECNICKTHQRGNYSDLIKTAENVFVEWTCRNCKSELPATIEYAGPEILTVLKRNKKGLLVTMQRIDVRCSVCNKIVNTDYYSHKKYMLSKPAGRAYECHHCIHSRITTERNKSTAGKTFEQLYGEEKAKKFKQNASERMKSNPDSYKQIIEFNKYKKGKNYVQLFGNEKAEELYKKFSVAQKNVVRKPRYGKDNPQFGKPAAEFSGRGWKGHYKGTFFRSVMELSFIVNYLNANNIKWESGEQTKHKIPYLSTENRNRNYFPDFITETEIIEVKPSRLLNFGNNLNKKEAAIIFANQMNKQYKIYTEKDFRILSKFEIYNLEQTGDVIFATKGKK